jgi:predicted ATP-dependent protease
MRSLADLLREANHWAESAGATTIADSHIQQAIDQQLYWSDRIRMLIQDEIERGTLLIDTDGVCVGQVNGLSVLELGDTRFGQPSRITATARLGRGEVIDIERETKLGGAIHSKGVLIISSLLASRYARNQPLPLTASLVFEQSYGAVDGDSASVAEFAALVSALAGIPIRQELAVTGSLNQLGQVQPIGGVNEKIEGFFEVCRRRGLNGRQGVLIPSANVRHLMLRRDVVEACAAGKFHVYAVKTLDEALTLLTGVPAGEANAQGRFPAGTVNAAVETRVQELLQLRSRFGAEAKSDGRPSPLPE